MRFHTVLTLVATFSAPLVISAQEINATYFQGLLDALNSAGLTTLESIALNLTNTTVGGVLLSALPGGNKTILAPSNQAFEDVPDNIASNTTRLANVVAYHILNGAFNETTIASEPNVTIARTFLNSSSAVHLEGNRSQVVILQKEGDTVNILNQEDARVTRSLTYENLAVHVVNRVLSIPPTLQQALEDNGLQALQAVAQQANYFATLEDAAGVTIFAPTSQALQEAQANLGGADANLIGAIIRNHVINGTSAYSTTLLSESYVSAGGQAFSFSFNNNTNETTVTSGNSTATITKSDIIVQNGVIHLIDAVLFNNASDPGAAESAAATRSNQATQTAPEETGGVGSQPTNTPGSAASLKVSGALWALSGVAAVFIHAL